MPPPLAALAVAVRTPDGAMRRTVHAGGEDVTIQFVLYDILRREQALAAREPPARGEIRRILDLAWSAHGDLAGVVIGRDDALLDGARDGEWTLRDVLRHAIAVELRYASQVEYAATRADADPLPTPEDRLPCDRLTPPREFDDSRGAGIGRILALLGVARERTDAMVGGLDDGVLARPSLWGTYRMDVRRRIHQIAAHLSETAVQVEKILRDDEGTEARRIVRRACVIRGVHERWSPPQERRDLDARYAELAAAVAD